MAYATISKKSGKTYHLHSKEVTLRGGHKQTIYYFAGSAGRAMPWTTSPAAIRSSRTRAPGFLS